MKRGAERQLAKDDTEEDLEDSNPGQGFRKADDSTLATRPIRGLPRRSMASTPTGSPVANGASNSDEPSTPKLGAFSGFGSHLAKSQSFTFTPPPTPPSSNPIHPSSQSFNLGFTSSSTPFSGSPFSTSSPTVAPSASSATKTFASFLGPSSSGSNSKPDSPAQPLFSSKPTSDPAAETTAADSAASKYYAALRGINVAFLSALTQAVDEDPFVNIAEILDQYTTLRISVQKDFDSATKPKPPPAPTAPSAAMPTPPTSFFGFGGSTPSASSSTTTPLGVGFVPDTRSASSRPSSGGFTFPLTVAAPTSSKPSADASATSKPSQESSGSSNPGSISLFGTGSTSKSTPSLFNTTQANPFELPKSESSITLTFGAPSKTDTAKVTTSLFGQPSSSSTGLFGSSGGSTGTTASLVSGSNPFGAPSAGASKFGGFGGFGKPAGASGSLGNPVGFGFGSPPTTPDLGSSSGTTSNFFAQPKAEEKKAESAAEESSQESTAGEGGGESTSDPSNLIASKNPHDEEGEGEEDEETVHAIKLKAYRLTKKDAKDGGGSAWSELGYGVLRVKTHKQSGARRLLLRNSSTGKININFNLYTGLKPSLTKRAIMFVGHDQGASVTYNVRLQTEEQAKELKDVLDREIAFVKAKTGPDS